MRIDRFFENQPEPRFKDMLCAPRHKNVPAGFGDGAAAEGEIRLSRVRLECTCEHGGLLDTAIEDFRAFSSVCDIAGDDYIITLTAGEGDSESFLLDVREDGAEVVADGIEGLRRAIYFIEDEMIRRGGAILPLGKTERIPIIKRRISRGFFSPTNRAPKWGDELLDGVDYYPDGYLAHLAHNGTNGLWIYTSFAQLVRSPYFPEWSGDGCERRMEKLRAIAQKCARYGIGVYVFAIEPMGLLPEEREGHDSLLGAPAVRPSERGAICLRSEDGAAHVIYCLEQIFSRIPELCGYIDITAGERPTSCASIATFGKCPRCSAYSRGENLAHAVNVIKEGLRRAGTGAEFVSWTYGHRYWTDGDILEYTDKAPSDVVIMQNFEDKGYDTQLGKPRIAWDYWLSYVGPSPTFEITAERARALGKRTYAKMQVCSSHEIATVPYIPAPGILYDKYKKAVSLGVSGIMECWYFGNYPSVMNMASTALSYADAYGDKSAFLRSLAGSLHGRENAERVAEAYAAFEQAYRSYPTNIMFSYYGPMHDGVVWELHPIPRNLPLSRSWLLLDVPDGDRIGECLFSGHTLDEALELADSMCSGWRRGLSLLPFGEECELVTCAKAIGLLFESGRNILRFYKLRGELGYGRGDARALLSEMESIAREEIRNSLEMARLCEVDPRLGYHSEAEGFKFFPEKLSYRAERIAELFDTEFAEIRSRIEAGRAPLGCYFAEGEDAYLIGRDPDAVRFVELSGDRSFGAYYDDDTVTLIMDCGAEDDFSVCYELELFRPEAEVVYQIDEQSVIHTEIAMSGEAFRPGLAPGSSVLSHQGVHEGSIAEILSAHSVSIEERDGRRRYTLVTRVPAEKWDRRHAIKLNLRIGNARWKSSPDPVYTLGKSAISPDEFGYILPI